MRLIITTFTLLLGLNCIIGQTTEKKKKLIDQYVSSIDSTMNLTHFTTEGIFIRKDKVIGGFTIEIYCTNKIDTNLNLSIKDTIFKIEYSNNIDNYLTESYYYKNHRLIFFEHKRMKWKKMKVISETDQYFENDELIFENIIKVKNKNPEIIVADSTISRAYRFLNDPFCEQNNDLNFLLEKNE